MQSRCYLVCLLLFIMYWSSALIYAALTLEEVQSRSRHKRGRDDAKHRDVTTSNRSQRAAPREDGTALEIPGIGLQIPAPASTEDPIQIVYANHTAASATKGLALLLHACSHSAFKFFSPSPACPRCVGLSEELRIARLALQLGYAPVAVSSAERRRGCWSAVDLPRIAAVLQHALFQDHARDGRNVFGIGASSGGNFAAELAARNAVQGALVMSMSLSAKVVSQLRASPRPIYLAPMPRDERTMTRARQNYRDLARAFTVLDAVTCGARPLTPEYLIQRVPGMTDGAADDLVAALQRAGHLDAESRLLRVDPTRSDWRTLVSPDNATCWLGKFDLTPGYSPLAKALHRAWAFHEYCSEAVIPAFVFFEQTLNSA